MTRIDAARALIVMAVVLTGGAAGAQGFARSDLTQVVADAKAALGDGFAQRAEAKRLTLTCPTCAGEPMIDLQLGRQTDGTEERVRSGQTTIARLEELCRSRNPECRMALLSVPPAVGWISAYPLGGAMAGSTAVIIRGGDLLTIRSIASDPGVARRNADLLVRSVVPKLVAR